MFYENCANIIYAKISKKSLCWSRFLENFEGWRFKILWKREFDTNAFLNEFCEIFSFSANNCERLLLDVEKYQWKQMFQKLEFQHRSYLKFGWNLSRILFFYSIAKELRSMCSGKLFWFFYELYLTNCLKELVTKDQSSTSTTSE